MTDSTAMARSASRLAVVVPMLLSLAMAGPAAAQEHEQRDEHQTAHAWHTNHFGGMVGVSMREGQSAALTLGLEYTRQLSRHWGLTGYVELVSSQLERDVIVTVGAVYYPTRRLGLILAVGGEQADVSVVHQGVPTTETELALVVRTGAAYGFAITPEASLGPTVLVDFVGDTVTYVAGLAFVVGF
jgi:hypothetical protein